MTLQLGSHGPLVSRWTQVMLKRFRSYALGVDGTPLRNDGYYGYDEQKVQKEYERRTNQPQDGIVSSHDLGQLGLAQPVIFTVEGHLSNMWIGPTATIARTLQEHGVCYWQPVGYDCGALPFNDQDGINQLTSLVGSATLPDGTPFPPGTPWGPIGFSQGAEILSKFMATMVLPENAPLHWRLKDFRKGLCLGNPRREKNKIAPWASNPARPNTQGILSDSLFVTTGTVIADRWQENAKHGDLFSENTDDDAGRNKTAIARIVCENAWTGGQLGIVGRVLALLGNPFGQSIPALTALVEAIMFAVSNPNPHYTTVAEQGDIDWMAGVAA